MRVKRYCINLWLLSLENQLFYLKILFGNPIKSINYQWKTTFILFQDKVTRKLEYCSIAKILTSTSTMPSMIPKIISTLLIGLGNIMAKILIKWLLATLMASKISRYLPKIQELIVVGQHALSWSPYTIHLWLVPSITSIRSSKAIRYWLVVRLLKLLKTPDFR